MPKTSIVLTIIFSLFLINKSQAQKWLSGSFYDIKGNKETGLIQLRPSGKPVIREEAFIEFKDDSKASPFKLSASELKAIVIGRDSFIVAAAPRTSDWRNEFDFVRVAVDEDLKLYVFIGGAGSGGGGGIKPGLGGGVGVGSGGYGGGFGGGISIPIGGGGGKGGGSRTVYYFGANTAEMKELNNTNFADVMSEIMGDEPEVVDQVHENKFNLGNIEKLIAYFNKVKASHN